MKTETLQESLDTYRSKIGDSSRNLAAAYELARDRVFARSWQWIGNLADVAAGFLLEAGQRPSRVVRLALERAPEPPVPKHLLAHPREPLERRAHYRAELAGQVKMERAAELAAHHFRHAAADACVDLVEHHRRPAADRRDRERDT